jgi:hypothetical protein
MEERKYKERQAYMLKRKEEIEEQKRLKLVEAEFSQE